MSRQEVSTRIKQILIDSLSLDLTPETMADDTLLLGDLPEFDSMAIVSVITDLEESFGFVAEDDELTADVFESVASLIDFVMSNT